MHPGLTADIPALVETAVGLTLLLFAHAYTLFPAHTLL
jgi:hypothetical protein